MNDKKDHSSDGRKQREWKSPIANEKIPQFFHD